MSRVKIHPSVGGLVRLSAALGLSVVLACATVPSSASAAEAPVGLGTATDFAVVAGSAITNTGTSVIEGNVGIFPGTAITGLLPADVQGTVHTTDAVALQAQADVTTAYNDAAGRTPTESGVTELGGRTLTSGVYSGGTLGLTGTVTLNGDANSVFIFQTASTLITASASRVVLTGGATSCNVYWQVGSSATLGTGSTLVGSVLALTSITANTATTVEGRLLARNDAVTLDSTTIAVDATCTAGVVTPPPAGGGTTPTLPGTGNGTGAGTVPLATAPQGGATSSTLNTLPPTGSNGSPLLLGGAALAILAGALLIAFRIRLGLSEKQ
ncbi:ice-binding family protein [Homoserinimonas hongtaonis]|uniref:DUF3494 domain-containing protein n=1 Tax=Homoserinimonas hongtaonis TaxID=2079791 RepID=A0A2U1T2G8_9MICO|nr:ice-binding family protein [Salinibacterium hongtaonis]AWB88321.1 hypothetical protein C2138_01060 [Salinibacterium hongtaonis]PWB98075.1 DUF3494 domain-containing protein [Salinibacterium hongtaonis]